MRTTAAVLRATGAPLSIETLALEPPRAGEVLVRVAAAGVCHSDLHLIDGGLGDGRWPIVPGHEGAGVVEAVGDGVEGVAPGDPVAFCFVPPCGGCRSCLAGRRHLCETAAAHAWKGTLLDGTSRLRAGEEAIAHFNFVSCFAERCVMPAACAIPIPPELALWEAALLGCGVVTGVGAVRNAAQVAAGESVCVIGCGGIGLQIIAGARLAGAGRIVAVDLDAGNLEIALARGATHAVHAAREDTVAAVLAACPGGVDHAFEAIGRPVTIRQAFDVLRPGATAIVVGIAPRGAEVSLPAFELLSEKGLKGCYYGSADPGVELAMLARLVTAGRLTVGDVVTHVTDLAGIDEALERLRRGDGARTIVVLDAALAGAPASVNGPS